MTTVLNGPRSSFDAVGQLLNQQLSQNLPGAVQQGLNRGMLQKSLDEIKTLSQTPGTKPIDMVLSAMKAGAGIPGSERYMAQIIPILQHMGMADASQKAPVAGEQPRNRETQEVVSQRQNLPSFLNKPEQENKFFPSNIGAQGGPGNVPQAATTGQKKPLLTREEKIKAARELAKQKNEANIPTTVKEAYDEITESENENKLYNAEIDKELKERVEGQKTYGTRGTNYLAKNVPESYRTPEIETIFQKKGEEASKNGDSEADINRFLQKEAERFSNAITFARQNLSAPRVYNKLSRLVQGTYRDFDQGAEDLRKQLEPLLSEGLYDTSRRILNELGYGPEERDIIINPLSMKSQSILNQTPKLIPKHTPGEKTIFTKGPERIENIKNALMQLKQDQPNFSLLLARKLLEDRDYDWSDFKDGLNALENEGFKLEDDQKNERDAYLNSPPLNILEKMLEGLNLIGR